MIEFAKESLRIFFQWCFGYFMFNIFLIVVGVICYFVKYMFKRTTKE